MSMKRGSREGGAIPEIRRVKRKVFFGLADYFVHERRATFRAPRTELTTKGELRMSVAHRIGGGMSHVRGGLRSLITFVSFRLQSAKLKGLCAPPRLTARPPGDPGWSAVCRILTRISPHPAAGRSCPAGSLVG